jgi:CheY-like chemotaxis protein
MVDGMPSTNPCRLSVISKAIPLLATDNFDRRLAEKYPLTFLVAEDNKINRKILVNMLSRLGYSNVYEAFDGKEAVRVMSEILHPSAPPNSIPSSPANRNCDGIVPDCRSTSEATLKDHRPTSSVRPRFVDVILMDLWMPGMDGYEATERIFQLVSDQRERLAKICPNSFLPPVPTVLAVSADVTDEALRHATRVGMEGYMTKPYKLSDLERLIVEFCVRQGCGEKSVGWRREVIGSSENDFGKRGSSYLLNENEKRL